jgi:hypothetical protein
MYSPRIRDDLIPRIYHAAGEARIAMTTWVNRAIEAALAGPEQRGGQQPKTISSENLATPTRSTRRGGQQP